MENAGTVISIPSLLPIVRERSLMAGKTFIGIDFGTSTSVVSIATYDENTDRITTKALRLVQLLPDGAKHYSETLPTVIAYYGGRVLVGEGASELMYQLKPGKNIWSRFKMELGEDLGDKYYESELRDQEPYVIKRPKDAARVFFKYLRTLIDKYCKENGISDNISYAVSIPAAFEANQRKDLLEVLAANEMEMSSRAFIDEPNAAFISYAVTRATDGSPMYISPNYNSKVLVFDFGGGTCDISVLEIGMSVNGFFSKNIAISKFMNLGGGDIDRYITYHYLLPRFLTENGYKLENFTTNERKRIVEALYKIAERLKILLNKSLSALTDDFVLPKVKDSDDVKKEIRSSVRIETNKGTLKGESFFLTNKELTETMKVFLKQGISKTTRIKQDGGDYNSIFTPIEDAVKKAHVSKNEIDYVLFIGGSAKSPYIQCAVKNYFEDSEMLVPMDLQTHVSQGAAIHSLLYNGLNKCLIQPITSEPLLIITKDECPKVILPAGTQIPCNTIEISDLVTSTERQSVIELPICVGSRNKMLFNLKIEAPTSDGFPMNSPLSIYLSVNSDKVLTVNASCMGIQCAAEPLSPFANKEMTTEERIVFQAVRQMNNDAYKNGGTPSRLSLEALRQAYEKANNDLLAAETYERQSELYPSSCDYNCIGVAYNSAGCTEKAIEFYEKALAENPRHEYANANLGSTLRTRDPERARYYLEKAIEINPEKDIALIELARLDLAEGNKEEAHRKMRIAYEKYLKQWNANNLPDYAYGWFSTVADELGEYELGRKIRAKQQKSTSEDFYDAENLAKTRIGLININK